mgnify:FL=1
MGKKRPLVPAAREALDKMKVEFSNEFSLELDGEYKGNKTSKLNVYIGGPIGGMMTRKAIEEFEKNLINKK